MTFAPRFTVLMVLMGVMVIPSGLLRFEGWSRPLVVMAPALVFCGLFGQDLVKRYRLYDKEVSDFSYVVKKLPAGGRVVNLPYDRYSRVMNIESAFLGLANLYPALRPAPGSMMPLLYCGMRHMPCRLKKNAPPLPDPTPWLPNNFNPETAVPFFDYYLMRMPPGRPIFGAMHSRMELVAMKGAWVAYRRRP